MDMKVLVVGGGGREHAITTALSRNKDVHIYAVMARRNPGIAALAEEVLIAPETDVSQVCDFAKQCGAEYAVVGPEGPLEAGVVDGLEEIGVACAGPTQSAARIETDKAFCRQLMENYHIAGNPKYRVFHSADEACVFIDDHDIDLAIKPIGLTGGKGVRILGEHLDREGAKEYIREINGEVVLEERLIGEEFTIMAFVDGTSLVPMPIVQDHKRAYEGDVGPNTGGMGSYTLADHMMPFVTTEDYGEALRIMGEVVAAMKTEDVPYKGMLYGQFMNTADGPKVIEFNARFGDPEALNLLSLLCSDFSEIVRSIPEGTLDNITVLFEKQASVCKYLVPEGYPESPSSGNLITIGDTKDAHLYYANVEERDGNLYTLTSRALAFVGLGDTLEEAEEIAESAAASVQGRVMHRKDIGTKAVLERRCAHMKAIR